MQAGETDVGLELSPRCTEHHETDRGRVGDCRADQCGLANACVTGDQERAAVAVCTVDERTDDADLQVTSDQLNWGAPTR